MRILIDDIRQTIALMHNIDLCDDQMTFYYDETGNCGKFVLREDGVNDPLALNREFILGGVSYVGDNCPADVGCLFSALNIQSDELKFRNICRSKYFMLFMGNQRTTKYIDWLYNSGLYVHYVALNNLYFSLVDMVDSVQVTQHQKELLPVEWNIQMKTALYNFCMEHIDEFLLLLSRFHYPNIQRDNVKIFTEELCSLIELHNDESTSHGFMIEIFRQMLKSSGKQGELVFLRDNEDNILIEEYYSLYMNRCYTFKYSTHHFDQEEVISRKMHKTTMMDSNGKNFINYDFLDSKQNALIQISDVFVGLISRLFEYLDSVSLDDIVKIDVNKNRQQLSNLNKLYILLLRAEGRHKTMIQNINDVNTIRARMEKLQLVAGVAGI